MRETQNQLVNARQHGRINDLFQIHFVETHNVLGDGSGEQFNVLRQITDIWPRFVYSPLIDVGVIEPYNLFANRPDSD